MEQFCESPVETLYISVCPLGFCYFCTFGQMWGHYNVLGMRGLGYQLIAGVCCLGGTMFWCWGGAFLLGFLNYFLRSAIVREEGLSDPGTICIACCPCTGP